jgi:recombinational DNA repair protein RecT
MSYEFLQAKLAKVVHATQELRNAVEGDDEASTEVIDALDNLEEVLSEDDPEEQTKTDSE